MGTWDDYFDDVTNDPASWVGSVKDLLSAAAALKPQCGMLNRPLPKDAAELAAGHRFLGPILLLRACAVECTLKVQWLKQGKQLAKGGRLMPIPGSNKHELVPLAGAVGFALSNEERGVLDHLSVWNEMGRFPTPAHWAKWTTKEGGVLAVDASGEQQRLRFSWSTEQEDACERLLTRVSQTLG